MTSKKVVHYNDKADIVCIQVGRCATVFPVDHPDLSHVSNQKYIFTSTVQAYDPATGIFETLNTIYKPVRYAFAGI